MQRGEACGMELLMQRGGEGGMELLLQRDGQVAWSCCCSGAGRWHGVVVAAGRAGGNV